jgi:putative two-component system response regulator
VSEDLSIKTLLIVDDSPVNIAVLKGVLSTDYKVKVALNGEKVLQICSSASPPDLILLDIMMPEMDGYEVCRRLKSRKQTKDIPVIFVTAKGGVVDETLGFEVGAIDYIAKPVSPPIVLARVKNILDLHQTRGKLQEALNKSLTGSVELMMDILSLMNPTAFGRSRNLRRHVSATAKRLGYKKRWSIEVAAMLSQLGCITLPSELVEKVCNGEDVSVAEQALFDNHPQVGKRLLEKIPNFQEAAEIIALQNSELDESGSQVQLGASLLQVALQLDNMDRKWDKQVAVASPTMQVPADIIEDIETVEESVGKKKTLTLAELKVGMVFNCDVKTRTNMVLIRKETEVTRTVIERLKGFGDAHLITVKTFSMIEY